MRSPTTGGNSHAPSLLAIAAASFVAGAFGALLAWKRLEEHDGRRSKHRQDLMAEDPATRDLILHESISDIIYMDYNGTTPVSPTVLETMMPYFTTHYGNPSSSHGLATEPKRAILKARQQILESLLGVSSSNNGSPSSIVFTSCGTESDNMAIYLALDLYRAFQKQQQQQQDAAGAEIDDKVPVLTVPSEASSYYSSDSVSSKNSASSSSSSENPYRRLPKTTTTPPALPHIITCNVEHPAVEECLQALEARGECTVSYVAVQPNGCVLASDILAAVTPHTILITLMLANNESGALQPVRDVCDHVRLINQSRQTAADDASTSFPIYIHTDAAQAAGKISVRLDDLGQPDMVSLVGHKLGAPKGVACLYVAPDLLMRIQQARLEKHGICMIGGAQEFGLRAGTPNVPYIAGMGQAAVEATSHLKEHASHLERLRGRLLARLIVLLGADNVRVNGPDDANLRLPNTWSVGIRNVHSGDLLAQIGNRVAASAGATCHSAGNVSSVLRAMQVPLEFAKGTLRLSLGPSLTEEEVDRAANIIATEAMKQLS